jgi:aerotaxis receptor
VSRLLGEISASAGEQQSGVAQINEAVTHLDGITQQNAAMVEQLAAAAASLRDQVASVSGTMNLFRLSQSDRGPGEADAVAMRREARAAAPATKAATVKKDEAQRAFAAPRRVATTTAAATPAGDDWSEF